jgi:hypothetical protein
LTQVDLWFNLHILPFQFIPNHPVPHQPQIQPAQQQDQEIIDDFDFGAAIEEDITLAAMAGVDNAATGVYWAQPAMGIINYDEAPHAIGINTGATEGGDNDQVKHRVSISYPPTTLTERWIIRSAGGGVEAQVIRHLFDSQEK